MGGDDADHSAGHGPALEESFEATFRDGYWPLVRALTVAAGDREVAADCVADAFERAYARWRRISRYDDPIAWVRRVALNRIRDHGRRAGRGRRAVARLDPQPAAGPGDGPLEPDGFDAAAVLGHLPPRQRTAAALYYVENLTVAETAAAMHLSQGAVKYHLHQAREALRPLLAPIVSDESP